MKPTDYETFKKEMLKDPKVKMEYNKVETFTQAKLKYQIKATEEIIAIKKEMDKIKCWLGLHKWSIWMHNVYGNWVYRYCPHCGKQQDRRLF